MNRAVVYYSLSGNTKEAAKVIARKLGAKIFEIDLVKPLPKNTVRRMLVGGMQSTFGRRPKIKGVPDNIDYSAAAGTMTDVLHSCQKVLKI